MNRRLTVVMTFSVLGGFIVILLMNVAAMLGVIPAKFISQNDVRGVAVEHKKLLYTLNFRQQRELIEMFNHSFLATPEEVDERSIIFTGGPSIDKIIIYRFDAPDIEIIPNGYIVKTGAPWDEISDSDLNMVFIAPLWNPNGFIEESSAHETFKMLLTTYDH